MTPPEPRPPAPAAGRNRRLLPAAVIAALLAAAYPAVLFGERSFFYRDFGVLAYPTVAFAREAFWQGTLPLWNPLSHCGVPFLAQWGTMALYPGSLLYLLLPLPWSLNWFALAHLWLAGWGMYRLAHDWTGQEFAAAIAAVSFTFSGVAQACLLWPNYTAALGWMPWVVWLVGKAACTGGHRVVVAAVVGALQLLTGVPEIVGMTWLVAVTLALGGKPGPRQTNPGTPPPAVMDTTPDGSRYAFKETSTGKRLGRLLRVFLLMAGLCAAQLLPFFHLLAESQRAAAGTTGKWALPGWGWANFLVPLFRCDQTIQDTWFQPGQEFLGSVYLGMGSVGLALCGLTRGRGRRPWLLAGLGGLGLTLAMGEASPVYRGLQALCPPLAMVRYPVKFVVLLAFCIPLLAGGALAGWQAKGPDSAARPGLRLAASCLACVLPLLGVMLGLGFTSRGAGSAGSGVWANGAIRLSFAVGIWIACGVHRATVNRRVANLAGLAVLTLLVLDFRTHLPRLTPTLPSALLAPRLAGTSAFPRPGQGRVFITPEAEAHLLHSRVADFALDYLGKRLALWSNLNLLEGVAKVNGAATLRLRGEAELEAELYAATNVVALPFLDFLGVTWINSPTNVTDWQPRPDALPLVTAGEAPRFLAPDGDLPELLRPDFDPRRTVILPIADQATVGARHPTEAIVSQLRSGPETVEFTVVSTAPTLAVIAQTYQSAWQATLDGERTRLLRANHAFQAVEIPAGQHRVRLRYVDRSFRLGVAISAVSMLVAGVAWRWRDRRRPG